MSYEDIFILGWLANAFMLFVNILVAFFILKANNPETLKEQSLRLHELKQEFDTYYPYHKQMTIIAYFLPFTGFFRILFKLLEMSLFLSKNKKANAYDFIEYKYQVDINRAKNSN